MGETSLVVALVMGEVVKREKTKSLFNAVLVQNNVSVGPLTTVTHHHPIADTTHTKDKDGESSDSDDDNAKDNDIKYRQDSASKDTINVASTNLSPQVTQRRKRDVIKSASVDLGQRILLWFVTLPLNFIPVVGPLTFCYINAKARIPDIHRRYFDLKEMTVDEREAWIKAHQSDYRAFAFVSQALELIPLLGIFFSFTNTIGAALWAVELERDQETLRKSKRE
ncbi:hypothetical protein BX616_005756 [Lobosporangium transversale]|nr:hypothetical protein BX616_005756 [Lobosporangium transversale]